MRDQQSVLVQKPAPAIALSKHKLVNNFESMMESSPHMLQEALDYRMAYQIPLEYCKFFCDGLR
jgi:hypothetical protein